MWEALRRALECLWQWAQKTPAERRTARARERFWTEVREGEREAEDRSRP
jgi:hypothetical protein